MPPKSILAVPPSPQGPLYRLLRRHSRGRESGDSGVAGPSEKQLTKRSCASNGQVTTDIDRYSRNVCNST